LAQTPLLSQRTLKETYHRDETKAMQDRGTEHATCG
jgi:hypothetical protein